MGACDQNCAVHTSCGLLKHSLILFQSSLFLTSKPLNRILDLPTLYSLATPAPYLYGGERGPNFRSLSLALYLSRRTSRALDLDWYSVVTRRVGWQQRTVECSKSYKRPPLFAFSSPLLLMVNILLTILTNPLRCLTRLQASFAYSYIYTPSLKPTTTLPTMHFKQFKPLIVTALVTLTVLVCQVVSYPDKGE
jgi:hypothetical protein